SQMFRRRTMIEKLESRTLLSVSLVKDINTEQNILPGLWGFAAAGSVVYLSQEDTTNGWELYKSDGTEAGTTLVKDVRPGRDGSQPGWMTMVGSTLFFTAEDGANGIELWKSDGTEAGTQLVKDINPGAVGSAPGNLTDVNGTLFFSATNGVNGVELWKSDGSAAGTVMVKDIHTTGNSIAGTAPQLINNNGVLFFRATTSASGAELWKSDGSSLGTTIVKDISSGSGSGMVNQAMTVLNGIVYFVGTNSTSGQEVWRSDGTDVGTTILEANIGSSTSLVQNLKRSGNIIYFTVNVTPNNGLWRTDGTQGNTFRIAATPTASADVNVTFFFGINTTTPTASATLYKTIGSTITTVKTGLTAVNSQNWASANGTLFFPADDGTTGEELWKSDGTSFGTQRVRDLEPGIEESGPYGITPYGPGGSSGVMFGAFTSGTGGALHKSDGSEVGTVLVKDVYTGTSDSGPIILTPFNNKVYFLAFEPGFGEVGGELYSSDGTEAGTGIVIDLNPGPAGANVSSLKVFGDYLYFQATNGATGDELWRTDGTAGGTTLVKDMNPGGSSDPFALTVSGSYLYFVADDGTTGEELWRTDGTSDGTVRLTNINPTAPTVSNPALGDSNPSFLTDVSGWLYFTAETAPSVFGGLWKTDGVSVIPISSSFTGVTSMLNINGTLFIAGTTNANGSELFKIDPGGTSPVLVKEINAFGSASPSSLTNAGGTLFFTANNGSSGIELWKSDGTSPGTMLVKDIRPGASNSSINSLVAANGVAYFRADDGVNGPELWRSDGTTAGTYLLKDILPTGVTASISSPTRLFAANGFVYFAADNIVNGIELWRTDGTTAGTIMLADNHPEGTFLFFPSNVAFFAAVNGDVYYRYTDDTHGAELWKADQPDFAVLGGGGGCGGALTISATGGNDIIDIAADGSGGMVVTLNGMTESFAPGAVSSINLVGHIGRDTVTVSAGTVTFGADAGAATANLTLRVTAGATAVFNSTQHIDTLELDGGDAAISAGGEKLLVLGALSILNGGTLDLADNDLVVDYSGVSPVGIWLGSAYDGITGHVKAGRIISAAADGSLKTLGVAEARDARNITGTQTATFSGEVVDSTAVLVKFTWGGDSNVDGKINIDDYGQIDFNIGSSGSVFGWFNGDFNYDGKLNIDDYGIIDFSVASQDEVL
ncbi:MAG: ELWxxDGT repeat protein, partial [Tepidisphaeraceae bacterium]